MGYNVLGRHSHRQETTRTATATQHKRTTTQHLLLQCSGIRNRRFQRHFGQIVQHGVGIGHHQWLGPRRRIVLDVAFDLDEDLLNDHVLDHRGIPPRSQAKPAFFIPMTRHAHRSGELRGAVGNELNAFEVSRVDRQRTRS